MIYSNDAMHEKVTEIAERNNLPSEEVLSAAKTLIYCGQDICETALFSLLGISNSK